MRGKAIAKIVICSVVAVVLCSILAASLLTQSVFHPVLHFMDGFDISTGGSTYTGSYQVGSISFVGEVKKLDLDWTNGSVTVCAYEGDEIVIQEPEQEKDADRLRWKLENGTLTVHEFRSGHVSLTQKSKTLELLLPASQAASLTEVKLDGVSATLRLEDLSAERFELDTTSGSITLKNCTGGKLDVDAVSGGCTVEDSEIGQCSIDTTSGEVRLAGVFESIEIDGVSAGMQIEATSALKTLEIDTVSGGCKLRLPADAGFTLKCDSASGSARVNGFENLRIDGSRYLCGDASAEYEFSSISGSLTAEAYVK